MKIIHILAMRYLKVSFKVEIGNVREESLMPYTESSSVQKQGSNSVVVCCCYSVLPYARNAKL